jgi:hypothetical protein
LRNATGFISIFESPARFGLEFWVEIFWSEAKSGGESFLVEFRRAKLRFLLRHGDALGATFLEANFDGQNSGAGLLRDVDAAFLRGNDTEFGKQEPRADHRVAGEF